MYLSRMCFMLEPACTEGVHFLSDVAKRDIKPSCAHSYSLSPEKGRCQKFFTSRGLPVARAYFYFDYLCVWFCVLCFCFGALED